MICQPSIVAKSEELHQIVDELLAIVTNAVEGQIPIHAVESKMLKTLLRAGRNAAQLLVDSLGDGDMGEEHQLPDGTTGDFRADG